MIICASDAKDLRHYFGGTRNTEDRLNFPRHGKLVLCGDMVGNLCLFDGLQQFERDAVEAVLILINNLFLGDASANTSPYVAFHYLEIPRLDAESKAKRQANLDLMVFVTTAPPVPSNPDLNSDASKNIGDLDIYHGGSFHAWNEVVGHGRAVAINELLKITSNQVPDLCLTVEQRWENAESVLARVKRDRPDAYLLVTGDRPTLLTTIPPDPAFTSLAKGSLTHGWRLVVKLDAATGQFYSVVRMPDGGILAKSPGTLRPRVAAHFQTQFGVISRAVEIGCLAQKALK